MINKILAIIFTIIDIKDLKGDDKMIKIWNEKLKDVLIRAFKTFIQGFLATLIVLLKESDLNDLDILKSLLIGALAGGISAVMNLIIKALQKSIPEEFEDAGDLDE